MTGRLLSITQLRERIPLAPSRIYELLALKHIPAPLKIGRRNFWVEAEIEEWIAGLTESATRRTASACR